MKPKSLSVRALLCAASISAMSFVHAAPVFAQQETPPQDAQAADAAPGDIVVTAQFRQQRLQDTPLAITAVDAAMLEAKNQTNLS
jgi:iron complex outermembrane recepter protein